MKLGRRFISLLLVIAMIFSCDLTAFAEGGQAPEGMIPVRELCVQFGIALGQDPGTGETLFSKDGLTVAAQIIGDETAVLYDGIQQGSPIAWVVYDGAVYVSEDEFLWSANDLGFSFPRPEGSVIVRDVCARYGIEVDFSHEGGAVLSPNGISVTFTHVDREDVMLSNGTETVGPVFMPLLLGRHSVYAAEFLDAVSALGFSVGVRAAAGETSFVVNKNTVVTGGVFLARAEYALPDGYALSDGGYAVSVSIPAGCSLVPGSVTLDGSAAAYEVSASGFEVRSGSQNGAVRFYVAAEAAGTHKIGAEVTGGGQAAYSIGSALVTAESITINVPEKTSQAAFMISGIAVPGASVTVYDNGRPLGAAAANMVGSWRLRYEMNSPQPYEEHEFYAEVAMSGGTVKSETKKMVYSADFAEVSQVTMIHGGRSTVFNLAELGVTPHYTYNPDTPEFTFIVEFVNSKSQVSGVTVVTTSGDGTETHIPALYDPEKKIWAGGHSFTVSEAPFSVRAEVTPDTEIDSSLLEPQADMFASLFGNSLNSADDLVSDDLTFGRSYPTVQDLRGNKGILGLGWATPYEARAYAVNTDSGRAILVSANNSAQVFIEQENGIYREKFLGDGKARIEGGKITVTAKNGSVMAFNGNGRLENLADANGNFTVLRYEGDQLVSIASGFGDELALAYAGGKVSQVKSLLTGDTADYQYDGDNLISVTGKYGAVSYTYSQAAGEPALETVTSPEGSVLTFTYDSEGRVVAESDGIGVVRFDYGGNNVTIRDAAGEQTVAEFNDGGLLSRFVDSDGVSREFSYLDGLLPGGVTLGSGCAVAMRYDSAHNLSELTDPEGQSIRYSYDGFGNISGVTDQRGILTQYERDEKGNNTGIRYADGSASQFYYDAAGLLTASVDQSGRNTQYSRDGRGNITLVEYEDGATVSYTYDSRSNVTSITRDGETTSLTYNDKGDLTSVTYPDGKSVAYTYDSLGRQTSATDAEGGVTNYEYGSLSRLTRVTDGEGSVITEYDYLPGGSLSRQANANGTSTEYQYEHGRVKSIQTTSGAGLAVISGFSYTYNADGLIASMTESGAGTWYYTYDRLGQLIRAVAPDSIQTDYEYDLSGNRRNVTSGGALLTYQADDMNRYVSAGSKAFDYDRNGNLISETGEAGTIQYEYNCFNQLTAMRTPTDTYEYGYDVFGNRDSVTVNGATTRYLYSPVGIGSVLAEYKPDGSVTRYIQNGGLIAQETGGEMYFYAYNHLGSTVSVTGADGSVANSYSYDQEGRLAQRTEAVSNPFTYVGQYGIADDQNGLYYMRARYMSRETGRFISQDPGGQESDLNLYRYAYNSSVNHFDITRNYAVAATMAMSPLLALGIDSAAAWAAVTGFMLSPAGIAVGIGIIVVLTVAIGVVYYNQHKNDADALRKRLILQRKKKC
ncbi:MAG: hypothetical protein LBB94_03135 [Clostridiales bacterium]|nr:hypothetical protein [Clostridiales bacterium]